MSGHHRLARQIDEAGASRLLDGIEPVNLGDDPSLDNDRTLINCRRAVADDQPRALIDDSGRLRRR
jgi:hypothetical protein